MFGLVDVSLVSTPDNKKVAVLTAGLTEVLLNLKMFLFNVARRGQDYFRNNSCCAKTSLSPRFPFFCPSDCMKEIFEHKSLLSHEEYN